MLWELIYFRLLHPYESVMKSMFHHQTLTCLPKHFHKKLNQAPCTIWYTQNITTFPRVTTVYKTNLRPGELIHMDFAL